MVPTAPRAIGTPSRRRGGSEGGDPRSPVRRNAPASAWRTRHTTPHVPPTPSSVGCAVTPQVGGQLAVTPEACGISTRRQRERRCRSATPDSTASQVSIGPVTTEPANAYASAEAGKRASHHPDEASAKSASGQQGSCHSRPKTATPWNRQPHDLSQPAVRIPSGRRAEASTNYPAARQLAATDAHVFPQVSAPFPAVSAAPAAVPVRAGGHRRAPSPPRTGSLPSSPDGPVRSPLEIARSSSRTSGAGLHPQAVHQNELLVDPPPWSGPAPAAADCPCLGPFRDQCIGYSRGDRR